MSFTYSSDPSPNIAVPAFTGVTMLARISLIALTAFAVSGCGMFGPLIQTRQPSIFKNPEVAAIDYKAVAVIGADDSSPTLRMSVMVREELNKEGVQAVRRSGRWTTEEDALSGICRSTEQPVVQGVVIVAWDTLILRECQTKEVAYRVQSNGRWTISQLAQELAKFIKTSSQAATTPTPAD